MAQIRIKLTEAEKEKLNRVALYKGISVTKVIKEWIDSAEIDNVGAQLFGRKDA